jgi:hypothetical protein
VAYTRYSQEYWRFGPSEPHFYHHTLYSNRIFVYTVLTVVLDCCYCHNNVIAIPLALNLSNFCELLLRASRALTYQNL